MAHAGCFSAKITNCAGSVESAGNLLIAEKENLDSLPCFKNKPPDNIVARNGDPIFLEVVLETEQCQVLWFKVETYTTKHLNILKNGKVHF